MSARTAPPFRADHVGSFLRPERLKEAREKFAAGGLAVEDLHAIEDECIREVVRAQENVGLTGITDGEFRRTYFHVDFLERSRASRRTGSHREFHKSTGPSTSSRRPCMSAAVRLGSRSRSTTSTS